MKKTPIYLLALVFSVQAHAIHLSTNDLGQVLIFPYYTVNGGFDTLINLVNTTDESKALRVRFREAANGREVFTFNLYLGPNDAWVGVLVKGTEEQGNLTQLISPDISCTVPLINTDNAFFYQDKFTGDLKDVYGTDVKRLHEGFIEVIEMGVLTGESAAATIIDSESAVTDCARLQNAWDETSENNYWLTDSNTDMLPPSGGIMGNVILIDVAEGIAASEEATVIDDFSDEILHFRVDNDSPSLADGKTTSTVQNNGASFDMEWLTGFEALSSVLMKTVISNEYALDPSINAKTDWIITMPTRQYHTDLEYASSDTPIAPFTDELKNNDASCEPYSIYGLFDREEQSPVIQPEGPPPPPGNQPRNMIPTLCYATNNLNISKDVAVSALSVGVFASNHSSYYIDTTDIFNIVSEFENGWLKLVFPHEMDDSTENMTVHGLPIIGFSVQKYTNANAAPGLLAQYTGFFKHKYMTVVTWDETPERKYGMSISENNIGQVLLYPYYTVKNGLDTLITVVNSTNQAKALKVRFLEGKNGREVLVFNVYLGRFDVWTAALVASASELALHEGEPSIKILTTDTSCTVPVISGQEFLPFAYTGIFDDGQGITMQRTQEGSIEIIEMGSVMDSDAQAIIHIQGVPESCETLAGNWTAPDGKWLNDPTINMEAPNGLGGLYGSVSIIDVAGGVDMSYDATAIVGYSTETQHSSPGTSLPNLASGNYSTTLIETEDGMIQTTWGSPLNAVTALFMQAKVINDFAIEPGIGAQTEWVNMFPTKQFYVDPLFSDSALALAPFNIGLSQGTGACEHHRLKAFNREQQINTQTRPLFPPDPPPPNLSSFPEDCWSVVVSDVNKGEDNNTILDSTLKLNDWNHDPLYFSISDLPYTSGWMQMDFVDEVSNPGTLTGMGANGETHQIFGKPVLGFVVQKYINGFAAEGLLANYAVLKSNKNIKKITIDSTE